MEILFDNQKIRELCENNNKAVKKLGSNCARKLRARLSDLEAVNSVIELVIGNPHPLKGDRLGQFALDLTGGWRLVFCPAKKPYPMKDDGGIDWSKVTIINIIYIGDYHG